MDIITHALTGFTLQSTLPILQTRVNRILVLVGALVPDIGEIVIQNALSSKYGTKLAVYDERTSDIDIAAQLKVTCLYDTLHSIVFFSLFFIIGYSLKNKKIKYNLFAIGLGLASHVLLDCFTHGKVWALKLFFPITNHRFLILENSIGNWWDWQPTLKIPFLDIPFPIICFIIWAILLGLIFFKNKQNNAKLS